MDKMKRLIVGIALAAFAGILSITFAPASLSQETATEVFHGVALPDEDTRIEIAVDRWTTEEERAVLLEVLDRDGSGAAVMYLGRQDPAGRFLIDGEVGHSLRYAREAVIGDIRQVVIATEEAVSIVDPGVSGQAPEDGFTLIVLHLDAAGNGEGRVAVGTNLIVDLEKQLLGIQYSPTEAIQFMRIQGSRVP